MDWSHKHILEILRSGSFGTVEIAFDNAISIGDVFVSPLGSRINPKRFIYKTDIKGIDVGDSVVVEIQNCYKIAKVVGVSQNDSLIDYDLDVKYGWVICKIDSSEHFKRIERENILKEQILKIIRESKRIKVITEIANSKNGKDILLEEFDIDVKYEEGLGDQEDPDDKPPIAMG